MNTPKSSKSLNKDDEIRKRKQIGSLIEELRKENGMSRKQLSEMVNGISYTDNISYSTIERIEKGLTSIKLEYIRQFAHIFNVDEDYLLLNQKYPTVAEEEKAWKEHQYNKLNQFTESEIELENVLKKRFDIEFEPIYVDLYDKYFNCVKIPLSKELDNKESNIGTFKISFQQYHYIMENIFNFAYEELLRFSYFFDMENDVNENNIIHLLCDGCGIPFEEELKIRSEHKKQHPTI